MKTLESKLIVVVASLLLTACGDLNSKPNQPVPNGGTGGGINSAFNVSTNNVSANNVSTNNVSANNVSTNNVSANNVNNGSTNNLETCGPQPGVPELVLGLVPPAVSEDVGTVTSVSADEVALEGESGDYVFRTTGVDLTEWFEVGDLVAFFVMEEDRGGTTYRSHIIVSEFGYAEFAEATGEAPTPALDLRDGWVARFDTAASTFACLEEGGCALQPTVRTTYDVEVTTSEGQTFTARERQTAREGNFSFYVEHASSVTFEEVDTAECQIPAATNTRFTAIIAGPS